MTEMTTPVELPPVTRGFEGLCGVSACQVTAWTGARRLRRLCVKGIAEAKRGNKATDVHQLTGSWLGSSTSALDVEMVAEVTGCPPPSLKRGLVTSESHTQSQCQATWRWECGDPLAWHQSLDPFPNWSDPVPRQQ
ncbi:UNVERIFIED_CONTAM: hypothetical protein K2H54_010697 [Gekko kuhli]